VEALISFRTTAFGYNVHTYKFTDLMTRTLMRTYLRNDIRHFINKNDLFNVFTFILDIHGSALEIQETNNNAGFHQVHSDFSIGISIVIFLLYLKGLDKCFLA
jgi:hypothetical protein